MMYRRAAWVDADARLALRQMRDPGVASSWPTAQRCGTCGVVGLYARDKQAAAVVQRLVAASLGGVAGP